MSQIRGPFILPRTSPQICGWPGEVPLQAGGIWLFPPGNSLVVCGPNTVVQYFNPLMRTWVPWSQAQNRLAGFWPGRFGAANPSAGIIQWVSSDGANFRLYNTYGSIAVTVPSPGGAPQGGVNGIGPVETGTSIGFDPSPIGQWATAQGYVIIGGAVQTPTIVRPGQNFEVPPIVVCDPPPDGGIQAVFRADIDANGGLTSIARMDPGAGYTRVPQFYIIPQPKFYQGSPRWPGDNPPAMPEATYPPRWPWPAPGLVDAQNVWPGTEFQPNIDNVKGALITGNPLQFSGDLTGIVLTYSGGGYTTAPNITFTSSTLTGGAATATVVTGVTDNSTDWSIVQAMVQ